MSLFLRGILAAATIALSAQGARAAGDGAQPVGLTSANGILYGTTELGGAHFAGTVFQITTQGVETVIYSFAGGDDGRNPLAGLTLAGEVFYGTTAYGGGAGCHLHSEPGGCGTVFEITPAGVETVLYRFQGGADGANPTGGVTRLGGMLYGATEHGVQPACDTRGTKGCGTIFTVTRKGSETILYSFQSGSDGADPYAGLTPFAGALYGVTLYGGGTDCRSKGTQGCGTVFQVAPETGAVTTLYRFQGGVDGSRPIGGLTAANGALYGTTSTGGGGCGRYGCGTVFRITADGAKTTIHRFKNGADGANPFGALTKVGGALYGTTSAGGGGTGCGGQGCGVVFEITPKGFTHILYRFLGGADGGNPLAGMTAVDGVLYGTTLTGGGAGCALGRGCGTVFRITPDGTYTQLYAFQGP